jgi:hypothetical protein
MLDKIAVLSFLDSAKKETIFVAHQNLGKSDLSEKLIGSINNGDFDYNPTNTEIEGVASNDDIKIKEA